MPRTTATARANKRSAAAETPYQSLTAGGACGDAEISTEGVTGLLLVPTVPTALVAPPDGGRGGGGGAAARTKADAAAGCS